MMLQGHNLNSEQDEAVNYTGGAMFVLAGAGSGKTRVVTMRMAALIERGVPPERILGVTFTNKAAGEMRERVKSLTDAEVLVTTFHSLGARLLRESGHQLGLERSFTIYDEEDSLKVLKEILKEHEQTETKQVKTARSMISKAKNALQGPDDVKEVLGRGHLVWKFPEIYKEYERRLRHYNAVDFDDLLYMVVRLLREHPTVLEFYQNRWWHLMVDEYQDTNSAQYAIVKLLVAKHQNLCVVGDPDQSIYSWRGADISNILSFEQDFVDAKVVRLEQNYRSSQTILNAANALISHNQARYEKHLWSARGEGCKIKIYAGDNERAEGLYVMREMLRLHQDCDVPLREMALFYRTNAQSRHFEDMLLAEGIPYVVVGGVSFYQRREVKDILAFLRMVYSGSDFISFVRTINLPKRGVGPTTVERLRDLADAQGMGILDLCEELTNPDSIASQSIKLNKKQKQGLLDYLGLMHELRELSESQSVSQLVRTAMFRTGYLDFLGTDPETVDDRKENLDELVHKAQEWEMAQATPSLAGFLEELTLKAQIDDKDLSRERLSLMTLHNSKGLEFDAVFLTGLEEDLLPHANSRSSVEAEEEERRLCYVGMTRAREYLHLTRVSRRYQRGSEHHMSPSRFLREIPDEYVEHSGARQPRRVERSGYDYSAEYNQEEQPEGFAKGCIVMHKQFGIGVVQDSRMGSQGLTYKIFFQNDNEVKELAARFANLVKL